MSLDVDELDISGLQDEMSRVTDDGGSGFNAELDKYVPMPQGEGQITVRILPPLKGHKLFQSTRLHYLGDKRKVHCRREFIDKRWKGDCPVCNLYYRYWKDIELLRKQGRAEEAKKLEDGARKVKPVERFYYNAIIRKLVDPKNQEILHNVGPRILSVGIKLHTKILTGIMGNPKTEEKGYGNVTDFKTGRDFKIIATMEKGSDGKSYVNYDQSKFLDVEVASKDTEEIKAWIANLHDLTKLRTVKTKEEVEESLAIYLGYKQSSAAQFDFDALKEKYGAQKTNVSVDEVVQNVEHTEQETTVKTNDVEDVDISLTEEEFMNELENMKA